MAALSEGERSAGVVTCSSGNHGRAVAWAAERLGVPAVVCVPGWVDPVKLEAIRSHGAEARLVGESYDEAEGEAERLARETGRVLVHPFDDPLVVAGQGSVALEILEALPEVAELLVPLSGGGLVAGMACALEAMASNGHLIAVSARSARVMRASLEAGRPVELPEEPTLASALAGGIGLENQVTFSLVRDLVRHHDEVSEEEIARAMGYGFTDLGLVLEGGGATALATLLAGRAPEGEGPLVVVLSGGNVDPAVLARILGGEGA
jgi:threonine dehydratase